VGAAVDGVLRDVGARVVTRARLFRRALPPSPAANTSSTAAPCHRSDFIGELMQVAGLSYSIACFAALLAPTFADLIIPAILIPPLIGASSFCLWLLVKGVNIAKWRERVTTAPAI
jgi:hypothetical protein